MAKVTNPTQTINYGVQQGSDETITYQVWSDVNTLADLSNWTGHIQWRDANWAVVLDSATTPGLLTLTSNGEVLVFLSGAVTAALTVPDPYDQWSYDIKLTSPGGDRHITVANGVTTMYRQVTQ
jgi:hypothetical protein